MEKIATAELQPDGSFQTVVWISICEKDKPDLYFKVRQKINGNDRVIYSPTPIPCYTYWNHPSGKDVFITVTDPETVVCKPTPHPSTENIYVMPLGIGWDGWHEITQAHIKAGVVPVAERGLFKGEAPYGTGLDIQMQFHEDLRSQGVRYYRWSYRKEGETGWTVIDSKVTHRYLEFVGTDFLINTKVLGPLAVNGTPDLFEIPDPDLDWIIIHRGDRRFAFWQTEDLTDGIYQLKLEMFDQNGNKITDPSSKNFRFILPTGDEVNGTIPVDDNLYKLRIIFTAKHPDYSSIDFLKRYDLRVKKGFGGATVKHVSGNSSVEHEDLYMSIGELLGSDDKCSFTIQLHTYPKTRDGYSTIRIYENHDISSFAVVPK